MASVGQFRPEWTICAYTTTLDPLKVKKGGSSNSRGVAPTLLKAAFLELYVHCQLLPSLQVRERLKLQCDSVL